MANSVKAEYNPVNMTTAKGYIEEVFNNETTNIGTGYLIEAENLYNEFLNIISNKRICWLDSPNRLKSSNWNSYESTATGTISSDLVKLKTDTTNIKDAFVQIHNLVTGADNYAVQDATTGMYSCTLTLSYSGDTATEEVGFFEWLWNTICDFVASLVATFVDAVISLFLGLCQLLEGLVDGLFMAIGSLCALVGATDAAEWFKEFISKDWTNEMLGNAIYSSFVGSWILENSWLDDTARNAIQGAGRWIGVGVLTVVIPGSGPVIGAILGGASGFGMGAEGAFQNGADYGEAFVDALIRAGTDAVTGACVGQLASSIRGQFPSWKELQAAFKPNPTTLNNMSTWARLTGNAATYVNGIIGAGRCLAIPVGNTLLVTGTATFVDYVTANATNTVAEGANYDLLKPTADPTAPKDYASARDIAEGVYDYSDDPVVAQNNQTYSSGTYDETGVIEEYPQNTSQTNTGGYGGGGGSNTVGGGDNSYTPGGTSGGDPGYSSTPSGGDSTTPGGNNSTSGGGDSTTPGGDNGTTGGGDSTTPGGNDSNPGDINDTNPGGDDNTNPGGNDTNPGGDDNTNPGGNDTNPGGNDNTNPGGNDTNPGGNDNTNPGGNNTNPDGNDNSNPGGANNDPSHPKVTVDNKGSSSVTLKDAGALGAGVIGAAGGQYIAGGDGGYVGTGTTPGQTPQYSTTQPDNKKDDEDEKDKKEKYTFESMTPTVENPALDAGLLDAPPANVTVEGPEPGMTAGVEKGEGNVEILDPTLADQTTVEQTSSAPEESTSMNADKTNLNTVLGLGGISAGLGVGGVYVAQAKKDAENEQKAKEAARKLGVAGGMMAGALADDDDDDSEKKNNRNGFNQ